MKKLFLVFLLITEFCFSQGTLIKYKQMENPATSSVNLGVQTFSAGNATCSNVIARGTFSVGSTATITGGLRVTGASTIGVGQNNYFGAIISSQLESTGNGYVNNKLRIGSNVTPTATLDVTGDAKVSSTFSLGSANLTGGNTGTVAVLSDAVWSMNFQTLSSNPADAVNYTISTIPFGLTGFDLGGVSIPYNSTIVGWTFNSFTNGVIGTTETSTLQITLNGTATTLTTGIVSNTVVSTYSASGLSISVSAGDVLKEVLKTPTWATNPTSFATSLVLFLVRRS